MKSKHNESTKFFRSIYYKIGVLNDLAKEIMRRYLTLISENGV